MSKLRGMERLKWLNRQYRVGRKKKSQRPTQSIRYSMTMPAADLERVENAHKSRGIRSSVRGDRWEFVADCRQRSGDRTVLVFRTFIRAAMSNRDKEARVASLNLCNLGTIQRYNLIRETFNVSHRAAMNTLLYAVRLQRKNRNHPYEICLRTALVYKVCNEIYTVDIPIVNGRCTYLNEESLFHINNIYRDRDEIPLISDVMRIARKYGSESVSIASL